MPALQSFINNYKNVRKPKVLALLRGEPSGSSQPGVTTSGISEVLDIKDKGSRYSLDFDGGKPDHFESDILDASPRPRGFGDDASPQVKLDIDLAPEELTDWFANISLRYDAPPEPFLEEETLCLQRSRNPMPDPTVFNGHTRLVTGDAEEDDELARSSEEVLANLQAMDASHFGSLPGLNKDEPVSPSKKKAPPSPLALPLNASEPVPFGRRHPRDSISMLTSNHSLEETPSSAVSGTTLARALFSNTFSLSSDNRSSKYRSGTVGLTRSDSTTLGRGFSFYDTFSVGPDAPPMPAHAESIYEAPKRPRRGRTIQRRSSTGSLHPKSFPDKSLPATPSHTRPNSLVLSPGSEFDILKSPDPWSPPPVPSIPLSPSPLTPVLPAILVDNESAIPLASSVERHSPSLSDKPDGLRPLPDPQTPEAQRNSIPSFTASPHSENSSKSDGGDDVLGYYGVPESYGTSESPILLQGASFRPAVSPIREETSSQLSPPTPYKGDRRDSRRILPFGARNPASLNSQRSSMVRSETLTPPRRPSETAATGNRQFLPPLAEGILLDHQSLEDEILPPPSRGDIFCRQRSGSAPTSYPIERSTSEPSSLASPQRSGSSEEPVTRQDSPESAKDMFISGISSPTIIHDPSAPQLGNGLRSSSQPNLAQHLLITRAGSAGRHSRHISITGAKLRGPSVGPRSGSPSARRVGETPETPEPMVLHVAEQRSREELTHVKSMEERIVVDEALSRSSSRGTTSDSSSLQPSESSRTKLKSLPRIPVSPIGFPLNGDVSSPEPSASSSTQGSTSQSSQLPASAGPSATPANVSMSPITPLHSRSPTNAVVHEAIIPASIPPPSHPYPPHSPILTSHEIELTGGLPAHLRQYKDDAFGSYRGLSMGSPPPYYSVINETPHPPHETTTPSTSYPDQSQVPTARSSSTNQEWNQNEQRSSTRDLSLRSRPRPPLPAGPRRPSQQMSSAVPNPPVGGRGRSASVTSNAAAGPSRQPLTQSPVAPTISPKFQPPTPRWKGYTMEAAKWTFTSSELQAIVSKAIRQSAQASSVRLLQPDIVEHQIPQEIRRMEAQRTEVKTRYKVLTRRRNLLFEALSAHLSGAAEEDPTYAQRLLEDLREMAITLDRQSEELHSLDSQIAHLESLVHTHTSSALAMALRKLNTSFLKQMAQNQDLEGKLQDVQAERDEAWNQAQWVADELDQMADVVESPSPVSVSNRSSRVGANIRSSIRQSKAGLRASRRFSQMSSYSFSSFSSARSPVRRDRPPPVPPLPTLARRSFGTGSESSPLGSSSAFSPGYTPNSETLSQQNQVQEELYAMLGLTVPESSLRRSHSWNGLGSPPATADPIRAPTVLPLQSLEGSTNVISRRSSLPPDSTLEQVYNVMAADRQAILLTADMLSTSD